MFRKLAIASLGIALLASPTPSRADISPELMELAGVVGQEAAKLIGKVLFDTALANATKQQSTHIVSVESKRDAKLKGCIALPLPPITVKAARTEKGATFFSDPGSAYNILTLEVEVEVILLYPLKDIHRDDEGETVLPEPIMYTGFVKPANERGSYKYEGFGLIGWDEAYQKDLAKSLAYDALEVAKKSIKSEDIAKCVNAFKNETGRKYEDMVLRRTQSEQTKAKRAKSTAQVN